jgi:hypothetical protein
MSHTFSFLFSSVVQALLPEAIAVVLAPTDPKFQVGVFQLSESGMRLILSCPLRGFHPHPEGKRLLFPVCLFV